MWFGRMVICETWKNRSSKSSSIGISEKDNSNYGSWISGVSGICFHSVHYGYNGKNITPAVGVRTKHITSYDNFASY